MRHLADQRTARRKAIVSSMTSLALPQRRNTPVPPANAIPGPNWVALGLAGDETAAGKPTIAAGRWHRREANGGIVR